jgi:hypothetical protein
MPTLRQTPLSRAHPALSQSTTLSEDIPSSSVFTEVRGSYGLVGDLFGETAFDRTDEAHDLRDSTKENEPSDIHQDTQESKPALHMDEEVQTIPPDPLIQVLRNTRFTEVEELEDILAETFNLRNGLNIPMIGEDHGSDSEVETFGIEIGDDYTGDNDSDSASNYSQDDDSTNVFPLYTTLTYEHDSSPKIQNTEPPISLSRPPCLETNQESGRITSHVSTVPIEQLTNVLHHDLQSPNRRLNQRQRARSSSPLPLPPVKQADNAFVSYPSEPDASEIEQDMCASWPPPVYREIVKSEYRKVFGGGA